jgi:two-component system alkaline phosphatase synthesis response regulator PhoP
MGARTTGKVLVVDDDETILDLLKYNLEKEGYEVITTADGLKGIEIARRFVPDLILLDLMMPRIDGIETCRRLREAPELRSTTIVFLTARTEEYSEVAAFEAGADDYITKPIKPRALLSRLAAWFRREPRKVSAASLVTAGDIVIDRSSYTVTVKGHEVRLPRKEFELLHFLARQPNRVFNREDLLKSIWGTDVYVLARTVDVHIRKIREKVGEKYIRTVKGVGYKFNPEPAR